MEKSVKTRVMDFVAANGGSATFTQIQKFIVEEVKGWTYTRNDRGYFCAALTKPGKGWNRNRPLGYFLKPGKEERYLRKEQGPKGKYILVG
jgi:hypothetical protein